MLYRERPLPANAAPGTKPAREPVADIPLPPNLRRALVVLIRGSDGTHTARVIEDDPAAHPAGQLKLINCSKLAAAVGLDRRQYALAPGESTQADWGKGGVLVQVAAHKDAKWQIAFRKERLAQVHARGYVVIFDYTPDPSMTEDPAAPPPATIRFFNEVVPPKPPAKP